MDHKPPLGYRYLLSAVDKNDLDLISFFSIFQKEAEMPAI
jgi:hypothetical protein